MNAPIFQRACNAVGLSQFPNRLEVVLPALLGFISDARCVSGPPGVVQQTKAETVSCRICGDALLQLAGPARRNVLDLDVSPSTSPPLA